MTVRYVVNLLPVFFLVLFNFSIGIEREKELEVKILEKISTDIVGKDYIKVYLIGYPRDKVLKYGRRLLITHSCYSADIIIAKEKKKIPCKGKIILTTNYYLLLEYPDAIGAFYWKKGRPHIVFLKERLEEKGITLPYEYEKFIIELSDREND
ncbi:MAG TPA: hypothetical protein DEP48_06620 [Persephonella sp.]|uniref:Uncharacterized protein n=1 Tax=Persephonella marina (strain DSM 14350 / EX-H1) TaxID=123214 RepID=C0QUK1_PERMH|nr:MULTISPECIES: hypothetical protein [Persephonella]ACO04327.1 conserved hypothetical protein [Persephonella marina EX-H1]HCB70017.1 hypothetical protein [Persephonella sp.]